ncbi:MAG: hypothetical protein M3Z96_01615 [Pseudomonadota bacterium]|nr:hypothetical protein [Pseudomonadota bacterium]
MTTNAILNCLAVALTFSAAVFLLLGIRHPRGQPISGNQENPEPQANDPAALATRYANMACGVLLLGVALAAEFTSLAQGGPAYGTRSGNVPGGIVAIALATFSCLIGCLIARQLMLRRWRRKLGLQG